MAHSVGGSIGGQFAVQLFFVISGYLISYVLIESKKYPSIRNFYIGRALRIFPIYWVVAISSLLVRLLELSVLKQVSFFESYTAMSLNARVLVGLSNFSLFFQDHIMFLSVNDGAISWTGNFNQSEVLLYEGLLVPQAWSLGIELTFYLVAPFILVRRRMIYLLLISSVILRIIFILKGFGLDDPWVYRFFPTELAFFLLGSLSHQILHSRITKFERLSRPRFGMTLVLFLMFYFIAFPKLPLPLFPRIVLLFGIIVLSLPILFKFQSEMKFDNFLGKLSYPIYLWHVLVLSIVFPIIQHYRFNIYFGFVLVITCTLVLSIATLTLIENPIERIRTRLRKRNPL